jgi:hypothetical protein
MKRSRVAWEIVQIALLLAAGLYVLRSQTLLHRLTAVNMEIRSAAERAQVQDRLIGRTLRPPPASLAGDVSSDNRRATTLYWVVDSNHCRSCLQSFALWNQLHDIPDLDLSLILVGDRLPPGDPALRAVQGTMVWRATRADIQSWLGPVLPNTKILVDSSGVILMADSRFSSEECGWSFDAQLGSLEHVVSPSEIRANFGKD